MFVLSNGGVARGMSVGVVSSPLKIAKFINPGVMCTALGGIWGPGGVTSCGRVDRIPSTTPGAEPPRDARDSGSARSHSTHLETSSSNRP